MALEGIDVNAYTAPFMLTKSMQRDVYPAIDPARHSDLRADNKVILITGGAGGLGFVSCIMTLAPYRFLGSELRIFQAIAKAWINAGAKGVILLGRTQETLDKAVHDLNSKSNILVIKTDITKPTEVDSAFRKAVAQFGKVDVVVNTTSVTNVGPVGLIDSSAWSDTLDANVKGLFNISQAFIITNGGKGTIVNLTSALAAKSVPGMSAYIVAKLAQIKLLELIDIEQPGLRVFSVHPGLVKPEDGRGTVIDAFTPFAIDTGALTGALTLWLDTRKADFLKGSVIHSNWDVNELEQHKAEIVEKKLAKLGYLNGQLQPGGYNWSS